jgi:hypothetical protein
LIEFLFSKIFTEDTIAIKEITISNPRVTYEHSSGGKNINDCIKHLNLNQIKEVVGLVISGAKDMLEKGTTEPKALGENN